MYLLWFQKCVRSLLDVLSENQSDTDRKFSGVLDDILCKVDGIRKHHQEQSQRLLNKLKQLQQATKILSGAVILLGEDSRIIWANDSAADYLGIFWPRDEGVRISNLLRDPELADMLQVGGPVNPDERVDLLMNQQHYLEFRIMFYGENNRLLVARDITEIRKTDQIRKDFIANVSHELKTPLTVILGYLESLESDSGNSLDSDWRSVITKMRPCAERMQCLIDDLLKLSSLESGRSSWSEVTISELLLIVFNEVKSMSGERDHVFSLEIDSDLGLMGNQQELYSAFSNLIFNSVRYTPDNGTIRIRWFERDGQPCMEVIDSGKGISAEHIPRLTERFYRVDEGRSRDSGGVGLGLSIVKHVLVNHNSRLEIESELGKGSTFRCVFPAENRVWRSASERILV